MSKNHWLVEEACAALPRIRSYVHRTPLHASSWLSHACSAEVLLKLESEQITGSFKSRGAVNKVLCLTPDQIARGLVTASTGNHALAFTYATTLLKAHPQYDTTRCTIYLPSTASLAKVQKLQRKGANLQFHGNDSVQAELAALAAAEERGMVYISPYNDKQVSNMPLLLRVHPLLHNWGICASAAGVTLASLNGLMGTYTGPH